jgi:hypothetical protein
LKVVDVDPTGGLAALKMAFDHLRALRFE